MPTPSTGVGRGRKGIPRKPYSIVDGKKLCKGPLHGENGEWLPANSKYFIRRNEGLSVQYLSVCRRCRRFNQNKGGRTTVGYVEVRICINVFREIVRRLGKKEASRRIPYSLAALLRVLKGKQTYVEAATLERALILRQSLRDSNIVRHRRDIKHGSSLRGLPERTPVNREDFYVAQGDRDNEIARLKRKSA